MFPGQTNSEALTERHGLPVCWFVSFLFSIERYVFSLECHLYCLYELQVLCWLQFVSPFASHEWCRKVIKAARWYTHNVLNGQNEECSRM